MLDPIRRLLAEAGKAKQTRAFWQSATEILSGEAGGARVELTYKGLTESGTLEVGVSGKDGETFLTDYHDAEGRHVSARFEGLPAGFPSEVLRSTIEIATHLAVMVARRAGLERERRLGTFLVELSRWLLAAPERELLLRYTLQSVTSLVDAQGAYVALRSAGADGACGDDRPAAHVERRRGRGGRGALPATRRGGAATVPARGAAVSHGGGRLHRGWVGALRGGERGARGGRAGARDGGRESSPDGAGEPGRPRVAAQPGGVPPI